MDISDSYKWDLAEFGGDAAALHRHVEALTRACDFIYKALGNPANIHWMRTAKIPQFDGATFEEIRGQKSAKLMEVLADMICSGRIPLAASAQ